jgi:hypothetical protein
LLALARLSLADGTPALTSETVDTVTDFVEWVLDVPFTRDQRDALRNHLVDSWERNDKTEINGVQEIIKGRLQLDKLTDPQKKELARQMIRTEILKQWRQEATQGDKMARLMVEIFDSANKAIAAGDPPLTRQSTDATLEILHFMASKVVGAGDVAPGKEQKDQFATSLIGVYERMLPENKRELAEMPMYWAALRAAWPELAKDQQEKLTAAWATSEQVKPIVEEIKQVRAQTATHSDPLAAAKAMQKLYQQHQTFVTLSNISYQSHMARMNIINNIGASNYRYEYRYRYR